MLINLRGPSGSGKSAVVHRLLSEHDHWPLIEEGKTVGYRLPHLTVTQLHANDIYVIGPYPTPCGGCDRLTNREGGTDRVEAMVERYAGHGHVLFEGLLISTMDRWIAFSKRVPSLRIYYLDTTIEQCIANVLKRNGGKDFNHANIRNKHRILRGQFPQMVAAGVDARWLEYGRAYEIVRNALIEAKGGA